MKEIWKYTLKDEVRQVVTMPEGAKIISVQDQHGDMCIWAIVDKANLPENRKFVILGTCQKFAESSLIHLGTVVREMFVWHVFEDLEGRRGQFVNT